MILDLAETAIGKIEAMLRSGLTLSVGVSFGKDSTSVLCLVIEAMMRLKRQGVDHEKVFVTTSNTKRENAAMDYYCQGMILELEQFICDRQLNMAFHEVKPPLSGTFIWTVIGRGKFPRYPGLSRDCSVDEKIRPQQSFVKKLSGDVICLIGSRSSESVHRSQSLERHSMDADTVVSKDGAMTFAVIADWDLLDVWDWLSVVNKGDGDYECKFFHSLDMMSQLYKDANDGVCGVIAEGQSQACGSRFGCSICVASGEDKSLKSMLEEAPDKYGFMQGYIAIQEWLFNIRFDLNRREYRGRRLVQMADGREFISVAPDYFDADTKLELLRYLITLDAVEVERAHQHNIAFHAGELDDNEWNRALCYPMFEMITKDAVLAVDFAWSIGRDFRTASEAAKAYVEIHELKKRYYPPQLPRAEKPTLPEKRWIDVTGMEAEIGLSDPYLKGRAFSDLAPEESKEVEVTPGGGFSYISAIKNRFNDLKYVDISETARAAIANDWIRMPLKDFRRYHKLALRNELLFRAYNEEVRLVWDEIVGDDVIQTLPDYLNSISVSDDEFKTIRSHQLRIDVETTFADDLFGVDGIVEAMEEAQRAKECKRPKKRRTAAVESFSFSSVTAASRQLAIAV